MKTASLAFVSVFTAVSSSLLPAQAQFIPDPEPYIVHQGGINYSLNWHGHAGFTYFIQTNTSYAEDGSLIWDFVPDIRFGTDAPLGMGFEASENTDTRLYRVVITNRSITIDHNLDDFDGDGKTNLEEVSDNTNPFDAESFLLPNGQNNDPTANNNGFSSAGLGGNGSNGPSPEIIELTHTLDDFEEIHEIELEGIIPTFKISTGDGVENKLELTDAPEGTTLNFLEVIPNLDYDAGRHEETKPEYFTRGVTLTTDTPWTYTGFNEDDASPPSGNLLPMELAPDVLAVNSDFDEGRIDPDTGYAIPDCDDIPGVDRKTGAGNG